jgi:ABC-type glycerol-3-phosphate transport system permease component
MGNSANGGEHNLALWTIALLLFLMSMFFIFLIHGISRRGKKKNASNNLRRRIVRAKAANSAMTGGVLRRVRLLPACLSSRACGLYPEQRVYRLYPELLQFNKNGIGNQFFNTVYLVFLSLVISVPIGVAAGIYMGEYQGRARLPIHPHKHRVALFSSLDRGRPFRLFVFILMTGAKWNLMAGALAVLHSEPAP